MPFNGGSPEPQDERLHPLEERALRSGRPQELRDEVLDMFSDLTAEEQDRIADGEPYCFRCGKPASSLPEYDIEGYESAVDYIHEEEGTYNPDTNRFACDRCYIAIGMTSAPHGWKAP